jgi:preprotein translocase subunit SecB
LAACRVWSQREWSGDDAESKVTFKPSVPEVGEKAVVLPVSFSVRIVDNAAGSDIFGVECELEGRYSLRPDYHPTPEEVSAFQEANAVYHYWPFFREFVQSTSTRAGYPPVPVPLLTLSVERPSTEKQPKRARALKAPSVD